MKTHYENTLADRVVLIYSLVIRTLSVFMVAMEGLTVIYFDTVFVWVVVILLVLNLVLTLGAGNPYGGSSSLYSACWLLMSLNPKNLEENSVGTILMIIVVSFGILIDYLGRKHYEFRSPR